MMKITNLNLLENITRLLSITFTIDEYINLIEKEKKDWRWFRENEAIEEYWLRLPVYVIARCPICGATYNSSADTHSIFKWHTGGMPENVVFSKQYQSYGCSHFIRVNHMINLNGHFPTETDSFHNDNIDIPYITPELFMPGMESVAVMHSLPICKIEREQFVPKYSLYTITYYAERPQEVYKHAIHAKYTKEELDDDDGYNPAGVFGAWSKVYPQKLLYDLKHWVREGKLYWLDFNQSDLPLKSGSVDEFPYVDIQGFGVRYVYRKRSRPHWWWQQKNWHPDGEIRDSHGRLLALPDW